MATRVPNMCLVLKLDNGKVVSIAHEQTDGRTDGRTEPPSSEIIYRSYYKVYCVISTANNNTGHIRYIV